MTVVRFTQFREFSENSENLENSFNGLIGTNSLHMMDLSMENLKNGISGEPLDFSQYDFIENLPDDDMADTADTENLSHMKK